MIADLPRQGSAQKSHQVTLGLRGRRSRLGGRRSGFLGSGGCGGSLVIPAIRGPLIGQTGEGDGLIRLVLVGLNIMLNVALNEVAHKVFVVDLGQLEVLQGGLRKVAERIERTLVGRPVRFRKENRSMCLAPLCVCMVTSSLPKASL